MSQVKKNISVSVSQDFRSNYDYLRKYCDVHDESFSKLICKGMAHMSYSKHLGVTVSVLAMIALKHGCFEDLEVVTLGNGYCCVVLKEAVLKPVDGSVCKYQKELDSLIQEGLY